MIVKCINNNDINSSWPKLTLGAYYEVEKVKEFSNGEKAYNLEGFGEYAYDSTRFEVEEDNRSFHLSDLKSGMVIEIKDQLYLVIRDISMFVGKTSYINMGGYGESLKYIHNGLHGYNWDIVKVYQGNFEYGLENLFHKDQLKLLWERKEYIDMTLAEVLAIAEKQVGKTIYITDK